VGLAALWLVAAAAGVLTYVIVVGAPDLGAAHTVLPGSMVTIVLLHGLQLVAGLGFLVALATAVRRRAGSAVPELVTRSG
jgi:alpha-1,2-mannosyltransferase